MQTMKRNTCRVRDAATVAALAEFPVRAGTDCWCPGSELVSPSGSVCQRNLRSWPVP